MGVDWSQVFSAERFVQGLVTSGVRIALIVVGAFVVTWLSAAITRRVERFFDDADPTTMSEREKQAATLGKVIRNIIRIVVWGIAGLMILKELGVEIGPILAGVGIAGLAIGFGAQKLEGQSSIPSDLSIALRFFLCPINRLLEPRLCFLFVAELVMRHGK